MWDFAAPAAEVNRHPQNPALGGKNLTARRWVAWPVAADAREIELRRSIALADGVQVDFGTARGTIWR